jgi:hypothetical protein
MATSHSKTGQTHWQACTCYGCGARIMLLGELQNLSRYLFETSVRRRGYQCIICKQVICSDCSHDGHRCACGCNARVALPYLESMAMRSVAQQMPFAILGRELARE